ncbi:MAG: TonB-dependent receptor domain-containing protein, partial [Sphingopyxis sp.]
VSATSFRPTLNQRATPTTGWGGKVEVRAPVGAARTLRLGMDVRGADGTAMEDALALSGARTTSRSAGGRLIDAGAFAEAGAMWGGATLNAGARVDQLWSRDGRAVDIRADGTVLADNHFAARRRTMASFRGAAAYDVGGGAMVRASAYTGFRWPTLNELYRGFTIFPVTTRANAALEPERLRGAEAGITLAPAAGWTVRVTGFDNRLADAIANVTIATNIRQRRNIAAIHARGVEGEVEGRIGPWRLDAGWALVRARMHAAPGDSAAAALDGLRPAQTPQFSGTLSLGWQGRALLVQAGLRHVGAQYEDDRNVDIMPGATTADALARWQWRGLTLSVRGENLFNAAVQTRNAAGSIDLATPRTVWIGAAWALDRRP